MNDHSIILNSLGEAGLSKISSEFYKIMREDDLIGKMYPDDDWAGAEDRFCKFLLFRFGANQDYIKERGHPRLRMRHAPYLIGEKERDRWMDIMDEAMTRCEVPDEVFKELHDFFANVADFMRNH